MAVAEYMPSTPEVQSAPVAGLGVGRPNLMTFIDDAESGGVNAG
jgi:hypothetical protein